VAGSGSGSGSGGQGPEPRDGDGAAGRHAGLQPGHQDPLPVHRGRRQQVRYRRIRAKSVCFPIPMWHPNLDLWYLDLN